MPDDQTTRKVQHCEIRVGTLFPANEQASIAIEPAMRSFDDPATCPRTFALCLAFVPTATNPRHHADLPDMVAHTTTDIAQIQAQPRARRRRRLVDDDLGQGLFQQHAVVPMGARDDQCQRQAVSISELAALDAPFAAVGRVGPDFFPRPTGPWSSSRRAPANPSRSSPVPHMPAVRRARSARTRPRRSTRETAGAPRSANTTRWHRALSTAYRCAATAGSHSSRPGPRCAVGGSPADAVWAAGSTVPSWPTSHRSSASHHHAPYSSPCPPNREASSLDKQKSIYFNLPRWALNTVTQEVAGISGCMQPRSETAPPKALARLRPLPRRPIDRCLMPCQEA